MGGRAGGRGAAQGCWRRGLAGYREADSNPASPPLPRGLGESDIHLPTGLAAAGCLRPLALLPLRRVTDHTWLPACGCLDGLRGPGPHRARAGGAATSSLGGAALLLPAS